MTSQNCFLSFCAVRNFFFSIFSLSLSFREQRCVRCNLNGKGDSTIKLLNLDLFCKEVPRFCAPNLSKFKMSYLRLYLRYWKKIFSFQLPLNSSLKYDKKIRRFKGLKFTYEWRQQMWLHNLTFGVILWNILIGLMFSIFRPSLVGKESKQAKLF